MCRKNYMFDWKPEQFDQDCPQREEVKKWDIKMVTQTRPKKNMTMTTTQIK